MTVHAGMSRLSISGKQACLPGGFAA